MRIGDLSVKIISDGKFYLDGGAMFGVVPRVLWEKLVTPDDKNRIPLALNCFLVQTGEANILIETGVGEKLPDKLREIYSIQRQGGLLAGLAQYGLSPKDINMVILTHLHFDHCGGNTIIGEEGKPIPTFPNAQYVIQKGEWEDATNPSPLNRASYLPENFLPLPEHGQLL